MALVLFGRRRGKNGTSGQSWVEEEGRQARGHRVHDAYAFRRHREMCGAGTFEHCAVGRGSVSQLSQGGRTRRLEDTYAMFRIGQCARE